MSIDLSLIKDILETISYLVVIGGVPVALFQYIRTSRAEQKAQQQLVYEALDQRYLEYLSLCLQYPELDVFDLPLVGVGNGKMQQDSRRELILYTMLIEILEKAYLLYRDQPDPFRRRQWFGWEKYICAYLKRKNFQNALETIGIDEFDQEFVAYIHQLQAKK